MSTRSQLTKDLNGKCGFHLYLFTAKHKSLTNPSIKIIGSRSVFACLMVKRIEAVIHYIHIILA